MTEYIRKAEKVIDSYHNNNTFFSLNRRTALFNALTVFEDSCRLGGITVLEREHDRLEYSFLIREQLDALNILVQWIFEGCAHNDNDILDLSIIPERYLSAASLLQFHAKPYSPICSAYISYSRGKFNATANEKTKTITFLDNPDNRSIFITDVIETIHGDQSLGLQPIDPETLDIANKSLLSSIRFVDGRISYKYDSSIWTPFQSMMQRQWCSTSELPEEWMFDRFSVGDYKQFWIAIATFCFIHMTACLKSGVQGGHVEEAVLVKSRAEYLQLIVKNTNVAPERASSILEFLIYDPNLKNNDIVYQPFVQVDEDKLALAPHLVLSSRPERNLVTLIHKKKDKAYFELTNLREGIMQEQLDSITLSLHNVRLAKNKALPDALPDVDYAIWDTKSNTILVCELKWLIEADSTTEVFSREQDIAHGCNQVSKILRYAEKNNSDFIKRVFDGEASLQPSIIGCVISKKGIRVDNSNIPVISLQAAVKLFQKGTVYEAFEAISNRAYLIPTPNDFEFGLKTVKYAGFTFEIPALIKKENVIRGTYKRIGAKIGRNSPCPCGSGKKYKKCCGRQTG